MSLSTLSTTTAVLLAAAAVTLGALALASTRDLSAALGVLLDLLLAAGLLRLAALDTWTAIASAAALVAIRKLVVLALRSDSRRPAAPPAHAGPGGPGTHRWSP
jgi:hypothetical protein